jgi:hypothetical protein
LSPSSITRSPSISVGGAQGRNRTDDLPLRRRLLYPLSYLGGGM